MNLRKMSILVVDDAEQNRKLVASILKKEPEYDVMLATGGVAVVEMLDKLKIYPPDLILLDILMPGKDGFDVAEILRKDPDLSSVPVIFLTALDDVEIKVKAFDAGGVDYISKPFNQKELLARVNSQLQMKRMRDELAMKNVILSELDDHLFEIVDKRTEKIQKITIAMVGALENANLYNDYDTGSHIKRVSEYSAVLAEAYGCDEEFIYRLKLFSSLHDVGKVGISDGLLKKPGKYTHIEFEKMKEHVVIGGRMLDNPDIDGMARDIALYHHERWDGSGYTAGLRGEGIPLEARIVSIADVYDALTTERVYKKAYSEGEAHGIIREGAGKQFDPRIVSLFFDKIHRISEIRNSFQ